MEKFSVTYSTKNIPLPSQNDYLQRLIEKTEQFLRRMCWKAYLFLNPGTISNTKDTHGLKSNKNPPPVEELKEFENDMLKMIQSIKFKHINSPFLNKLEDDAIKIKNETNYLSRRQNHELLRARTIRVQRPSRTEHHQVLQKTTT